MAGVPMVAEWQLLYNRYHRKPELYQMQLKHVDLTRNKVACAPFGGPIAAIRDDAKIVQLFAELTIRKLCIFTSATWGLGYCCLFTIGGGPKSSEGIYLHWAFIRSAPVFW